MRGLILKMSNIYELVESVDKVFADYPGESMVVELSDLGESAYNKLGDLLREKGYTVLGVVNVAQVKKPLGERTYAIHVNRSNR